jgi:ribosomal protein S27AE
VGAPLVTREEVESLMVKYFPKCPLCNADKGYEISGFLKNYVQCRSCGAKWESPDFVKCRELKELTLWEPSYDGKWSSLKLKTYSVKFWQDHDAIENTVKAFETRKSPEPENSSWHEALILEKDENLIKAWKGDYEAHMTVMEDTFFGKQPKTVTKKTVGILALTSRRLVFFEERGIFDHSHHLLFTLSLEHVVGISMGGAILKYVSISDSSGEYVFHLLTPSVANENELNEFKRAIYEQVNARKHELDAEKKKERVHIVLDFSFLRSYIEKGGLALQKVSCPECGAPVKLPESGNQMICEHCKSTIYAADVFEKVKA